MKNGFLGFSLFFCLSNVYLYRKSLWAEMDSAPTDF